MEQYQEIANILALTMGVSWASGINLYAAIATLGIMGATGNFELPPDLAVLQNPLVIGAAGLMFVVEFFVDKIPGLDTAWDSFHTFIRIPAGAMLAAGAVGEVGVGAEIAAAILGGGLSAGSHATKAGTRVLINTSPEPVTNWTASITEDVAVIGGLWAAMNHPWLFIGGMVLFIALMIWLIPKLWRGIKRVFGFLLRLFGVKDDTPVAATPPSATQSQALAQTPASTPTHPAQPVPPTAPIAAGGLAVGAVAAAEHSQPKSINDLDIPMPPQDAG